MFNDVNILNENKNGKNTLDAIQQNMYTRCM